MVEVVGVVTVVDDVEVVCFSVVWMEYVVVEAVVLVGNILGLGRRK